MELHEDGVFARLDIFGNEDADVDVLVADFLVRSSMNVKTFKPCLRCRIIEGSHFTMNYGSGLGRGSMNYELFDAIEVRKLVARDTASRLP